MPKTYSKFYYRNGNVDETSHRTDVSWPMGLEALGVLYGEIPLDLAPIKVEAFVDDKLVYTLTFEEQA